MTEAFIDVVLVLGAGGAMYWLTGDPVIAGLWQGVVILLRGHQRHWREPPYHREEDR
jgi:hypothetical protein